VQVCGAELLSVDRFAAVPELSAPGLPQRERCAIVVAVPVVDPDLALRQAAVGRARELAQTYDDLVPLPRLREGFRFGGERVSFGSFQRGIHRSQLQRGPAALTVMTSFGSVR
jgi:hypothetical protein